MVTAGAAPLRSALARHQAGARVTSARAWVSFAQISLTRILGRDCTDDVLPGSYHLLPMEPGAAASWLQLRLPERNNYISNQPVSQAGFPSSEMGKYGEFLHQDFEWNLLPRAQQSKHDFVERGHRHHFPWVDRQEAHAP